MDDPTALPSRRQLRLQREAAQRAKECSGTAESVSAALSSTVEDETPTAEIPPLKRSTRGESDAQPSARKRIPVRKHGRVKPGKLMTALASIAAFAVAGTATSVLTISNVGNARAVQGAAELEQKARATIEPSVPDSLKKADGAADSARYRDLEQELAGASVQCDIRSGANSLVSAFVEDENVVIDPMRAGSYRLSSSFGWRYDPFTYLPSRHLGEDYAAPVGTPIYAIANGTVVHAGEGIDGRSSNLIVIAHEINGEKYTSWYVHMYDDGVHVEAGDQVRAGQHIGDVGSNGRSTGPHLHFEIHSGHELILEDGSTDNVLNPLETLAELGSIDVSEIC